MGTDDPIPPTSLRQVSGDRREVLYDSATTRRIELHATASLPRHALMARAGHAVARLARALQPHARCIWVACGPGNNGGDGLVAATHLHQWAQGRGGVPSVVVSHAIRDHSHLPADTRWALEAARQAGVVFSDAPPPHFDLAIDALFGIGPVRPFEGRLAEWLRLLRSSARPVLCVDLPSGLDADTGVLTALDGETIPSPGPRHTLSLLTLKPGLFTASGRDAAGQVWFDDLEVVPGTDEARSAWLAGQPGQAMPRRPHASHKGSYGDVVVIGGQDIAVNGAGMTGAAVLAARAALYAGAGRVYVGLLEAAASSVTWDPVCPELMFRRVDRLLERDLLRSASVVCGCGAGASVAALLPSVLSQASRLVLDADALNTIATDTALQALLRHRSGRSLITVLTPHPLEAARLLNIDTIAIMADRLRAAQAIADRFGSLCVLKGSGSVLAAPGQVPCINPTGNAALATAGTGDVLAGIIGAALARPGTLPSEVFTHVANAVFQHGQLADRWGEAAPHGLSASRLAARVQALD